MRLFPTRLAASAAVLCLFVFFVVPNWVSVSAQPRRRVPRAATGKVEIICPVQEIIANGIMGCPDTGCGTVDPFLNRQKNISVGNVANAETKDIQYLANLPNRVNGYDKIGQSREALAREGEGKMIRIMAYALDARKGSKESCNCGLKTAINTDNHIVLVSEETLQLKARATRGRAATATRKAVKARSAEYNTLKLREEVSQTAEFSPRVRVAHPGLVGSDLKALIVKAPNRALLVRVTGIQMYDSEHAFGRKLPRHNDWEIHPVFKLEYCTNGKTCTANGDTNWISMDGN